ncbi:zinc-binding dehydrogenase [Chloroflexi bacterium TSY]|nr:zinc-binding dehydrogenase [Chloroflexi bacterium TSY]
MARTGRSVIAHGQEFEIREYPVPDPAPGTLLLRQEMSGICGTDLHMWQNGIGRETILGHELCGVIEAIGQGVTADHVGRPVREGDRIIVKPGTDGNGAYGFQPPGDPIDFTGGFSDYVYVGLPNTVFLQTEAPAEVAVITEPFTVGVHAVLRGDVKLGDTVIVQGSGAIGLVTANCAKHSGAAQVIVVGGPADRLALAKRLGADVTINIEEVPSVDERREIVLSHTPNGKGADVVFECAGFLPATPEGLGYVRHSGTFVEVGHFVDMGSIDLNINQLMMRRNLRFEAIWGSRTEDFVRGLRLLEKNEYPYGDMVSHVLPLEKTLDGFQALNGTYRLGDETVVKIALGGNAR